MTAASVRRVFGTVKAITNLAIREYGLTCPNVFANVFIPDDEKASIRLPIPDDNLVTIQKECVELDDFALIGAVALAAITIALGQQSLFSKTSSFWRTVSA